VWLGLTFANAAQEEEEEASEVVSPYTTPPALRWLQDVYPNLTDDDYQPIECIQVT
jgi:hypothetical protein